MAFTDAANVRFSNDRRVLEKAPATIGAEYVVPNGVERIGKNAFSNCENLNKIILPQSLKEVEFGAFDDCNIREIYFGGTLEEWLNLDWMAFVQSPYDLYVNNMLLTYALIPSTISQIRPNCFYYCRSLKEVRFHNHIDTIGRNAFNKSGLKGNLVLPDGLKEIKQYAFYCCGIRDVTIPKTVTACYYGAFSCCYELNDIHVSQENKYLGATNGLLYTKGDGCLRAIVKNKYASSPLTLPVWIKRIASDTFSYSSLPASGVILDHEIEIIDGAFKRADGEVMVPPNLKHFYINSGIPKNLINDVFTPDGAFNNSKNELTVITENPFRTLGVYADSSQREINSNATKINRYLEIGRQVSFDIDLNNSLPELKRTKESVEKALSQINQPKDKLQYAMFWLLKPKSQGDEKAYEMLFHGDILGARGHASQQSSAQVGVNAYCLSQVLFQIRNIGEAVKFWLDSRCASGNDIWTSTTSYKEFTRMVCGENFRITEEEFVRIFLNGLLKDIKPIYLWTLVKSFNGHDYAKEYLFGKAIGEPINRINAEILKAQKAGADDSDASHKSALKLKESTARDIQTVKDFVEENNATRALVSDGLATQILQCSIDYYNNAPNVQLVAREVLSLMEYSRAIAEGGEVIKRCDENIKTVKKVVDALPPSEIMNEAIVLDRMCNDYDHGPKTVANALTFLQTCKPYIINIKEARERETQQAKKDKISDYLMDASTDIVAICLRNIIAEINEAIEKKPASVDALGDQAWRAVTAMDQLPIDPVFNKERYMPNRETLAKSHFASLVFMDEMKIRDYQTVDFRTENETWNECVSKKWYTAYIEKYPNGIHILEARQKQVIAEKNMEERKRIERKKRKEQEKKDEEARRQREIANNLRHEAERREEIENTILNWAIGILAFLLIMNVCYMFQG